MNFKPRWLSVWQRNFHVWQKLIIASLLGNFGDPLIYLLALGYGLGRFLGFLDGLPYLVFLASGIVCSSAMQSASFEGLYSAYTRMTMQKTWDGMLTTPLDMQDIVLGETLWAGTKGFINSLAILIVAICLHLVYSWKVILALPIIFLMATCFASMALIVTSFAKSYDFFTYYLSIFISPIMFLGGVFFPIQNMPTAVKIAAQLTPLYHAIQLIRPLMANQPLHNFWIHLSVLIIYTLIAYSLAVNLLKRRMIN